MPEGTILLIDDEASLRQVVARVLQFEGYTVWQAADARSGLEALRQHAAEVLVILCDVKLPDAHAWRCCRACAPWPHWPKSSC